MDEVLRLFPTPFMRARATLGEALVNRLVDHVTTLAKNDNNASTNLSHTRMLQAAGEPAPSPRPRSSSPPKLVE